MDYEIIWLAEARQSLDAEMDGVRLCRIRTWYVGKGIFIANGTCATATNVSPYWCASETP